MAAAHVTAPMGTIIRVTIISTGQSITVSVVDREPMHPGRIVDLTPAAADILGIRKAGKVLVRVSLATKTDPP
jgi:rare lipoprotein A